MHSKQQKKNDKKNTLEVLYDHYKDTFENQKIYLRKRNIYTVLCLSIIAALSLEILSPGKLNEITIQIINKNIGNLKIDFNYINNLLTFSLFWIVIMYYQINLLIEKYYKYLHEIEDNLSFEITPYFISREGKTYSDSYPLLSKLVHIIYTVIFPLLLICVVMIKWNSDINQNNTSCIEGHFLLNSVFYFGIIVVSLLYLSSIHFNDFKK